MAAHSIVNAVRNCEQRHGAIVPRTSSVSRSLRVLEFLAQSDRDISLSEMARHLDVAKSTLHQIMSALVENDYVNRLPEPVRYRIGPRVVGLAGGYLAKGDVVREFYANVPKLVARCGETIQLARLVGGDVLYLAKQDGVHPVRLVSHIGTRFPAHAPALGKAMLSTLGDEEVRRLFEGKSLKRLTPHTITSLDSVLLELETTRRRGYALDREEVSVGLFCVAAPIQRNGDEPMAVSISLPAQRSSVALLKGLGGLIREFASQLSSPVPLRPRLVSSRRSVMSASS